MSALYIVKGMIRGKNRREKGEPKIKTKVGPEYKIKKGIRIYVAHHKAPGGYLMSLGFITPCKQHTEFTNWQDTNSAEMKQSVHCKVESMLRVAQSVSEYLLLQSAKHVATTCLIPEYTVDCMSAIIDYHTAVNLKYASNSGTHLHNSK